jgi:hypothetical protein
MTGLYRYFLHKCAPYRIPNKIPKNTRIRLFRLSLLHEANWLRFSLFMWQGTKWSGPTAFELLCDQQRFGQSTGGFRHEFREDRSAGNNDPSLPRSEDVVAVRG